MSTSTSEERQEVAAAMREVSSRGVQNLTLGEVLNSILTGGAPQPTNYREMFRCLADLIDPTCHLVPCDREDNSGIKMLSCPACGLSGSESFWAMQDVRFCPHCGARVTSGGER